jgi:hypothetical protein
LFFGNFIHFFSDLTKSKDLYLLYPISKKSFNFSISNYFDIIPSIILIVSNFLIILFEDKLNNFEKIIPFLIFTLYFFSRYVIKRMIFKNILHKLDKEYEILVKPTLKVNIWNVIRVADNNIYLFNLDIIKRRYLFVKYFSNNISEFDLSRINESEIFNNFKNEHKFLYYQTIELKNNVKLLQVFDVKNFFNLFKREQVYYETKSVNNEITKEKMVL